MRRDTFVIVGTGRTGSRAAEALRDAGFAGRIQLIGEESHAPYDRPQLSKEMLFGKVGNFALYPVRYFAERQIELRSGVAVVEIERAAHQVVTGDGERLEYDRLLLATGSRPRRLSVPGNDLNGIHTLRTLDDSRALLSKLSAGDRLVVIGGGLIGLEVGARASQHGMKVSVVEAADRLMARAVPPQVAAAVEREHRRMGIEFRFMAGVTQFEGGSSVEAVRLADGTRICADLVLLAIGGAPCIELASAAQLTVDTGIVVDAALRSSDPDIYAAGDVASVPHPLFGRRLRLEHWSSAEEQGQHVAASMLGSTESFAAVPWFWSDQYDFSLQGAGLCEGADGTVRPLPGGGLCTFNIGPQGHLVGASAFGATGAVGRTISLARKLIAGRVVAQARALADPAIDLKTILKESLVT